MKKCVIDDDFLFFFHFQSSITCKLSLREYMLAYQIRDSIAIRQACPHRIKKSTPSHHSVFFNTQLTNLLLNDRKKFIFFSTF